MNNRDPLCFTIFQSYESPSPPWHPTHLHPENHILAYTGAVQGSYKTFQLAARSSSPPHSSNSAAYVFQWRHSYSGVVRRATGINSFENTRNWVSFLIVPKLYAFESKCICHAKIGPNRSAFTAVRVIHIGFHTATFSTSLASSPFRKIANYPHPHIEHNTFRSKPFEKFCPFAACSHVLDAVAIFR